MNLIAVIKTPLSFTDGAPYNLSTLSIATVLGNELICLVMYLGGEGGGLLALVCARERRGSHKNLISCFSCLWNTQTVPSVCRLVIYRALIIWTLLVWLQVSLKWKQCLSKPTTDWKLSWSKVSAHILSGLAGIVVRFDAGGGGGGVGWG